MAVLAAGAQPAKLPNLVMVLQDDLGYYGASAHHFATSRPRRPATFALLTSYPPHIFSATVPALPVRS